MPPNPILVSCFCDHRDQRDYRTVAFEKEQLTVHCGCGEVLLTPLAFKGPANDPAAVSGLSAVRRNADDCI